jgi:type VI secretion system protein ImpC
MADTKPTRTASVLETAAPGSLLDTIVENGRLGQTKEEQTKGKSWVKDLVDQVLVGQIQVDKDTDAMLGQRIKELDELISSQLNEVMHAQEFQKLEGSWRGLRYLVDNSETSTMLKIKVMNVSKKDILKDFTGGNDWERATIFKKYMRKNTALSEGSRTLVSLEITRLPGTRRTFSF